MGAPRATKRRCSVCHASYTRGEAFCPLDGGAVIADDGASQDDELVGTTIDNRYLISAVLGRGGMGKVYAAEHTGLGKRVALKFVSDADADRDLRARFRQEARAASQIVHENVVQIFDVGIDAAGRDFIAMEYVEGHDLDEILRGGPLPLARAISLTQQILRGLHVVHEAGIVHRDIKPQNIRVVAGDIVKIMDFGIAKSLRAHVAQTDTGTGNVIGTPQYMAPEQIADAAIDRRADLYAVGATLYAMLAGQPPHTGHSFTQRMAMPTPPSIDTLRPGLPSSVIAALERALAVDPAQRFPDARAFAAALDDGAVHAAARMDAPTRPAYPDATTSGTAPTVRATPQPRSLLPIVIAMAIMLVALGAAVIYLLVREPPRTTVPIAMPAPAQPDAAEVVVDAAAVVATAEPPDAHVVDAAPPTPKKPRDKSETAQPAYPYKPGMATVVMPPPEGFPPNLIRCICDFKNDNGSIGNGCARKAKVSKCRCRVPRSTKDLCPFPLTIIEEKKRKPDGSSGGAAHCVDRTRSECDPLDDAMPESCKAFTRMQSKGVPVQDAACTGYSRGMVESDTQLDGVWDCDICDWGMKSPKYMGKTGDQCKTFDPRTGKQFTGHLRC